MTRNCFNTLFESVPTPILIWRFKEGAFYLDAYNRAADRSWHEGLEMWKQKSAHELFKDQKGITGALRACLDFRQPIEAEGWYRFDFTTEIHYYKFQYTFLEEAYVLMYMEDITRQVEFDEEVQLYFKTALDMLCIMDWEGYFKKLSTTWEMTLGWSQEELRQRPVADFIHEKDREATLEAFKALKKGHVVIGFTNRFLCKDQTYKWLEWNSSVNMERHMIISAARDVTLQKEAEQSLKESIKAQESANNAKSEFLANMSHEIRTPLNAVIGFSELLKSQLIEPHLKTYVESINTAGRNLLDLVNDILDLSKLEAGMLTIHHDAMSLARCFHEIEMVLSQRIQGKNLNYSLHIGPEVPATIFIDEVRIRQIFMNIIGNAVKFTNHGSIQVHVQSFNSSNEGEEAVNLRITVEDTGIGIREEELENIFEGFRQSTEPALRKGGTGLGLTISQKLVRLLEGRINVKSKVGEGTTFVIEFDNVKVQQSEADYQPKDDRSTDIVFNNSKVLVVDDDFINRYLIREVLNPRKIDLYEASSGEEAIRIIKNVDLDLILMDIRLPDMNGNEIAQKVKQEFKLADLPIIALTASTAFEKKDSHLHQVFDAVITKPVSINELLIMLSGYLEHHLIRNDESMVLTTAASDHTLKSLSDMSRQDLLDWIDFIEKMTGAIRLNLIKELIEELELFYEEHQVEAIHQWAAALQRHADAFEVDKMNQLLHTMLETLNKAL